MGKSTCQKYAGMLGYKRDSENRTIDRFSDDFAEKGRRALTRGPTLDCVAEAAQRIEVFEEVIAALLHTPDPENPVPADDENGADRLHRIREFAYVKVLDQARDRSSSTSPIGNLIRRAELTAWAIVVETLEYPLD